MKKCKKLLALTMAVLLAFACFALPSFAMSSGSQYGLEATIVTDKESYKANEEIHVTVTVKNTNDFKVEDVSIESLLPETLTLKDGSSSTKTVDLEAGETLTLSFTAVKEKEETSATVPESEGTTPTETETVKPSESETDKPTETETVKPSETETAKPSESETIKPTETQQPSTQESTEQPTQAPTTEKATQPTTAPITTTTAPFTTGEATTLPSTTGTPSTTGGGIIGDLTTTFPKVTTTADSATTAQAENPNTGDSMSVKTLVIAIIALLAVIAVVIILMYKYKKQTTKIISLVMCVAIAATAITGVSFFTAKGADDGRKSFTVEKVITVDGEETKVNADVKYQEKQIDPDAGIEFIYFTTSEPIDVLVGEKTNVTFEAKISNPQSIPLNKIQVTDETGNEVGYLYDNGVKPDQNANDSIYTGTFELYSDKEEKLKYYANVGHLKSESCEIFYYTTLQITDWYEYQSICDDTLNIQKKYLGNNGYVNDEKLETLLHEILVYAESKKTSGEILYCEKNDDSVYMKLKSGISYIFIPQRYGRLSSGSDAQIVTIEPSASSYGVWLSSIEAWIDATYNNLEYQGSFTVPSSANLLKKTNLGYSYSLNNKFIDKSVTIEGLKKIGENKVIIWEGHGSYTSELHSCLVTGERADNWNSTHLYSADIKDDRLAFTSGILGTYLGSQYAITSAFVNHYIKQMDNSLVFLGACSSGKDDVLANAFLNKGAKSVLAFDNSTSMEYEMLMRTYIFYLLSSHEKYGRFCTVQEALVDAQKLFGKKDMFTKDIEEKLAELKLFNKNNGNSFSASDIIKFAGGQGTINDPYQIATAEQLDAVRYNLNSNFVLVNDIDLSEYENWVPIGGILDVKSYNGFQGTFDGKGHTIKNLKMNYMLLSPEDSGTHQYTYGLFANTQNSPSIKNIKMEDVDITIKVGGTNYASSIDVGSIVAQASEITSCTTKGKIKVLDVNETKHYIAVGGICARAESISHCTNEIDFQIDGNTGVYIAPRVGGIVAFSNNTISECINKGDIICREGSFDSLACGGISAASSSNASIINSKNYGMIDISAYSNPISVGGIVGTGVPHTIDSCINYGTVSARAYGGVVEVGGILGSTSTSAYQASINKSVNYGIITAIATSRPMTSSFTGGIIGRIQAKDITLSNCYNVCDSITSKTQNDNGAALPSVVARIADSSNYAVSFVNNHAIDSITLNGSIPTEDIGPDQKNGGSMTKAEIEKAIQDLGFELPNELPAAS